MKLKVQFVKQSQMNNATSTLADIVAQAMLNRLHREKD